MNGELSNILKAASKKVVDTFLPRRCVACGSLNPSGEYQYICKACAEKMYIVKGGACLRCGEILEAKLSPNALSCHRCRKHPPNYNWCVSACLFSDAPRELILRLKYKQGLYLLKDLITIIRNNPRATSFLQNALLVPVPLHPRKESKRKYNQSKLIADAIVEAFPEANLRVCDALKRIKYTTTQTSLRRAEHIANVTDAFVFNEEFSLSDLPKKTHFIIVDDVLTSGATMSECALVFKREGYRNIDAFSFAKRY